MSERPFMDLVLRGEILVDEIDDFVERWHNSDSNDDLHNYLGMSFEEYSLWASDAEAIFTIITARRRGMSLKEAVNDNLQSQARVAARADETGKLGILQQWIDAQPDR